MFLFNLLHIQRYLTCTCSGIIHDSTYITKGLLMQIKVVGRFLYFAIQKKKKEVQQWDIAHI